MRFGMEWLKGLWMDVWMNERKEGRWLSYVESAVHEKILDA